MMDFADSQDFLDPAPTLLVQLDQAMAIFDLITLIEEGPTMTNLQLIATGREN